MIDRYMPPAGVKQRNVRVPLVLPGINIITALPLEQSRLSRVTRCLTEDDLEMSQRCEGRVGECSQGSKPGVLRHVHGVGAGGRHPDHEPIQRVKKGRCFSVDGAAGEQEAVEAESGGGFKVEVAMEIEEDRRPVPFDGRQSSSKVNATPQLWRQT